MRYDENKTFPYPVLREGSEDYIDGAFQATIQYSLTEDANKIRVMANFAVSEPSLQRFIKTNKARYAVLVDARETYFRDLIVTAKPQIHRDYGGGRIKGPVTLLPYIVATDNIKKHRSRKFNDEYAGRVFSIVKGDVLALDSQRQFYVGQEVFAHIGTVFELVEEDGLSTGQIALSLEDEKIKIRVNPAQKNLLDTARERREGRSILLAGVYMPTLMQVLNHMAEDTAEFEDLKWYRSIKAKCDMDGIEIKRGADVLAIAQRLLSNPLIALNRDHFGSD